MAEKTEAVDHMEQARLNVSFAERSEGPVSLEWAASAQAHASLAQAEQLKRIADALENGAVEVLYGGSTV